MDASNKIKFDYAQIGAVNLHYATAGKGEKLVILLHGFPESWYSWRHQLATLSDEYTVVAPDLRGYGLSDKPRHAADYKLDNLVDDAVNLVHYFGREKAALVGHDWGAIIAWEAARKYPESFWKVGALQVPPKEIWRKNISLRQFFASWYMLFLQIPALPEWLLSRGDFSLLANLLKKTTYKPNVFDEADIAEYKKAWSEPFALTAMINYYRANVFNLFSDNPEASSAAKITVPALFIYGERDMAILPETVKNIGEAIDAPFEQFRIPDAAHWVQQEAHETVNLILKEFLAD
jgi:epoxide hydrolase 4